MTSYIVELFCFFTTERQRNGGNRMIDVIIAFLAAEGAPVLVLLLKMR